MLNFVVVGVVADDLAGIADRNRHGAERTRQVERSDRTHWSAEERVLDALGIEEKADDVARGIRSQRDSRAWVSVTASNEM